VSKKTSILIFTSKTGGGHVSLAEALRDELADDYRIEILDPQPGIVHWHYRTVSRRALWLWALEFQLVDTPARSRAAHWVSARLLNGYVAKALRSHQPDIVLSTYPFLTCEVTHAMQQTGLKRPFGMLLSDPNSVHNAWLSERRADAVLATTRETYAQAAAAGFSEQQLQLTGWPVRAQFYRAASYLRQDILTRLNLDPQRFTVFLQGGGEGAARFAQTVDNVHKVENSQIILAAGTNQELIRRYQGTPRLSVLPFTKEIAPYMAAADVVMGKAGPNMLFESVSLGRPFIATAYIPGQEQGNLDFIQRYRLGWVALEAQAQFALIARLAQQPAEIASMTAGVQAYQTWNNQATRSIRPLVARLKNLNNVS